MLSEDTYLTISEPAEGIYKDKGSKFIAYAYPVKTEEEIKQHLNALRKEHFSARHHCYAFRLGANKQLYRANDDGEPKYSAGKPILEQIQSKNLTNVMVVVVRYFGGVLLGVNGLVTAYKSAAADALTNAEIVENTVNEQYQLNFNYEQMSDVMKILKDENLVQVAQEFDLHCKLIFSVRKNKAQKVAEIFEKISSVKIKYLQSY